MNYSEERWVSPQTPAETMMFPEDGISRFSTGNNTQSLAFTNGYPDASLGLASFFEINQAKQGITYTRDGKPALYYSPVCMHQFPSWIYQKMAP